MAHLHQYPGILPIDIKNDSLLSISANSYCWIQIKGFVNATPGNGWAADVYSGVVAGDSLMGGTTTWIPTTDVAISNVKAIALSSYIATSKTPIELI